MADDASITEGFEEVCAALRASVGATPGRALSKPALMVDGKICAFPSQLGLVVKLPEAERAALLTSGDARPMRMGTRVMREWVALAPAIRPRWIALAEASARYVRAAVPSAREKRPKRARR